MGRNTKATGISWLLFLKIYTFTIWSKDSLRGMTVCERGILVTVFAAKQWAWTYVGCTMKYSQSFISLSHHESRMNGSGAVIVSGCHKEIKGNSNGRLESLMEWCLCNWVVKDGQHFQARSSTGFFLLCHGVSAESGVGASWAPCLTFCLSGKVPGR